MDELKVITHIPGWQEMLESSNKISDETDSYAMVALIFRATQLRCDALASVPVQIFKGETEVEWPFDYPLYDFVWLSEAGLVLTGGAYWLKLSNLVNRVRGLEYLNPTTMKVEFDKNTRETSFMQEIDGGYGPWTADEMVYFREFSLGDDIGPGVHPASVAIEDTRLLHWMSRFAALFFENGVQPMTIMSASVNANADDIKRLEKRFSRIMNGIKNAFGLVGIRGDANFHTITPPVKDLAMPDLYDQALRNVGAAYGIRPSMLNDPAANMATAGTDRLSFWSDTVRPRGPKFESVVNTQLLSEHGLRLQFNFDEMDIFQTDEAERSGSLFNLVQSGFSLPLAASILGYDLDEDQQAQLEADEVEKDERRDAIVDQIANKEEKETRESVQGKHIAAHAMTEDLEKWQRKAVNLLKRGKSPQCEFDSTEIDGATSGAIYGALKHCETNADIELVFDDIWVGYP